MFESIFEALNYKQYLNQWLDDEKKGGGRGSRARFSEAVGCQTAYTAQVLRGSAHLSLEQGEAANDYLHHTDEQGHFFLLLIQLARSGSPKLRSRTERQIRTVLESRKNLKNRLGVNPALSQDQQLIYYSSWVYAAIHALASVPGLQSVSAISAHLQIDSSRAAAVLEFLLKEGLLQEKKDGTLQAGIGRIHIGSDSPLLAKHHINWRLQSIRTLEKGGHLNDKSSDELHYSSVVSLSHADALKIREILVHVLKSTKEVVRTSQEERAQCLVIDWFKL